MNNIYTYIEKYGDFSFQEEAFNEVDAMIFSFLTYAKFKRIIKENESISLEKAISNHRKMYPINKNDIIAVRDATKLLYSLENRKRYKDIVLSNYEYLENKDIQFSALAFEYQKNCIFVAFEGTNELFSGWKEDFLLGCDFPTISHKKAIHYLNKHFTFKGKEIILGGHSKGGNLALVAGMYANLFVRHKIRTIYSGDGPGLLDKEFHSYRYLSIEDKYIHIIPNYSVVGILLNHSNDRVVHSYEKNILSHDIMNWEIENDSFKRDSLSHFSKELDGKIADWVRNTNVSEIRSVITNLERILERANVTSIVELKENHRKVIDLLHETKGLNYHAKKAIEDLVKILIECIQETKKDEFKLLVNNLFKWKNKNETK